MRYLPNSILVCAIIALVLINTDLFLPWHKGVQYPVDAGVVSVYADDGDGSAPSVPVMRSFSDTGKRVHVYIKSTYGFDDIRDAHMRTIKVLSFFTVLYLASMISLVARNRHANSQ